MLPLIKRLLTDPLWLVWASGLFSATVLAYAVYTQLFQGLHPCHLCILQRWPYAAIAALALIPLVRYDLARFVLFGVAAAFMVNTGIAFYHIGVEFKWWISGACSGVDMTGTVEDILARIQNAPVTKCDEVQWRFLGLSMAFWNMLICAAGSVVSLNALRLSWFNRKTA